MLERRRSRGRPSNDDDDEAARKSLAARRLLNSNSYACGRSTAGSSLRHDSIDTHLPLTSPENYRNPSSSPHRCSRRLLIETTIASFLQGAMGGIVSAPPGQRSAPHVTHHAVDLPRRRRPSYDRANAAQTSVAPLPPSSSSLLLSPSSISRPPTLLALAVDAIAARAPDLPEGLSALPPDLVQAVVDRLAEIGASMSEELRL